MRYLIVLVIIGWIMRKGFDHRRVLGAAMLLVLPIFVIFGHTIAPYSQLYGSITELDKYLVFNFNMDLAEAERYSYFVYFSGCWAIAITLEYAMYRIGRAALSPGAAEVRGGASDGTALSN